MLKGVKHSEESKAKIRLARARQVIPREVYLANGQKTRGERHGMWKGNKVGYRALHEWVERRLGKPDSCALCGKSGLKGHKIHWASKTHKYLREVSDWIRLCVKCHYKHDHK